MYVRAHVTPGAKKEKVMRVDDTTFEISVREPAERNLANARVRELLARACVVEQRQVRLIGGHRSTTKLFSVDSG